MDKFETWWNESGQESLYALNTLTDADAKVLAEIAWEAALAEQAEQEPVACNPSPTCARHIEGMPVGTPIYAAPVGAEHFLKAIAALREGIATCRAEALEEAEEIAKTIGGSFADEFLAAIRGLK